MRQHRLGMLIELLVFWSSGILTGNQTKEKAKSIIAKFWSSGILTGNQTWASPSGGTMSFGAVAF